MGGKMAGTFQICPKFGDLKVVFHAVFQNCEKIFQLYNIISYLLWVYNLKETWKKKEEYVTSWLRE